MDLCFEPTKGDRFTMEIGYFDSVLEIKEKVQKYQGIPVSKQVLIFNGQVLPDDLNVHSSHILDQSSVQLLTENNSQNVTDKTQEEPFPVSKRTVKIHLKFPSSKQATTMLEMDSNDTICNLKQRIQEMQGVPVNRLALHTKGFELNDNCLLHDYNNKLSNDILEIAVTMRPSPASSLSTGMANNNANKKLRLMVLTKTGTKKIAVDVNPTDNVGALRKELINLQPQFHFTLPAEGYFFIYNQNVMDEDRSFRWHQMSQGDTIEVFGGTVTGGS